MKLYRNDDGHFSATQEQAKAAKRTGRGDFKQVDVPTSGGREALADFLNELAEECASKANDEATLLATNRTLDAVAATPVDALQPTTVVPTFAPPVRPAPRLHPSTPTVDMMVDMIDRGDIDARGLSNLAESLAYRFQRLAQETKETV